MEVVYIVTSGEYSDYGINAVFSSKENAEKYVEAEKKSNNSDYMPIGMEEWRLDDNNPHLHDGRYLWYVSMDSSGNVRNVHLQGLLGDTRINVNRSKTIFGGVRATSKEHAIKIVNEKRIQLIANNEL